MLSSTMLQSRWALGHEPIVEVPRPDADAALAPAFNAARGGLPLTSAGGLQGLPIVNLQQEVLGHVEELLLDVQHGRIAYAVMGSGGFFGLGGRHFAIPWAALALDPEGDCLVVDVARERFERPGRLDDEELDTSFGWAGGNAAHTAAGWPQAPG